MIRVCSCFRRWASGVLFVSLLSAAPAGAEPWTNLLDADLSHWRTYLSFRHDPGYAGEPPQQADGTPVAPVGYDHDPAGVFRVYSEYGDWILHVSGEIYGCVFTRQEYRNYRLRLKVRWGERKWDPRREKLKDSGILYHSIGPAGVEYWRSWMLSQEFQIMEGHMGDYWSQATSAIDIRAFPPEGAMNAVASEREPFGPFGAGGITNFCLRSIDAETPAAEGWTELELVCFDGQSLHLVNGQVVMVLRNSRYLEDGEVRPLLQGHIQLQSEAAEVFFKDIYIQEITTMPAAYARYFE